MNKTNDKGMTAGAGGVLARFHANYQPGPEAIALRVHAQMVADGLIREDGRTRLCDGLEVTEYRTAGLLLGNADIANSCGYEPAGVPEKVSQCYPSQADMPQAVHS